MAEEQERSKFPVIPRRHWWKLRERFKKSLPSVVDNRFLASVLEMTEVSAGSNVLPALKTMGIVNDDGKPSDLAIKWRDDAEYPAVCKTIRESVYPQALRDVASTVEDKDAAARWFASHGVGEAMVNKALSLYTLLLEADPNPPAKAEKSNGGGTTPKPKKLKAKAARPQRDDDGDDGEGEAEGPKINLRRPGGPAVHLNVQIHISPEVTPEQIDSIFASMGKHLKQLSE